MKRIIALLTALLLIGFAAVAEADSEQDEAPKPANGYVLVTTATQAGWLPLPDEGEFSVPIVQTAADGTRVENVIHLTPDSVWMEDSTCEGHDCVKQGKVTLENRETRILSNMIICLPNQVVLELYTPEEVLEMYGQVPGMPESEADGADEPEAPED